MPANARATGSGVPGRHCAIDENAVRFKQEEDPAACGANEGLQVRVHSPRKRAGVTSIPPIEADAPKVVWAIDFQFDSGTIDGKAIKIASMIDEHTRESLLDLVERSITAERLVDELEPVFAAGGPPKVLRMDNGPEFISQALQQFCEGKVGLSYIPPGTPWNNGHVESFNNRLRKRVPQPQPLEHPARSPGGDRRLQTRT